MMCSAFAYCSIKGVMQVNKYWTSPKGVQAFHCDTDVRREYVEGVLFAEIPDYGGFSTEREYHEFLRAEHARNGYILIDRISSTL